MSRRGARPIEDSLRQLLAIMNALSRNGATIDAKGVSYLLGITRAEAAEAIADVMEAATGGDASTGVVLPLEGDPEQGIRLMEGFRPLRALRMTRPEAQAMAEVLDAIGVDDVSLGGIRRKIEDALFPREDHADHVDSPAATSYGPASTTPTVGERDEPELPRRLVTCLDALYCNRGLAFTYAGERGVSTERVVEPLSLQYLFGQWVLDALDLGDGTLQSESVSRETPVGSDVVEAEEEPLRRRRFFLVHRLRDVRSIALPRTHPELRNLPWNVGGEWVRIYFTDRNLYDRNSDWTWSQEVSRGRLKAVEKRRIDPDGCAVDVRYFPGSPYLARLVVACAGACTTDDPALLQDIREYLDSLP